MTSLVGAVFLALCAAQPASGPPPAAPPASPAEPGEPGPAPSEAAARAAVYASLPLPVRFGALSLGQPGQYVDYEFRPKGAKPTRVRVAYVLDKVDEGHRLRQVELDYADLNPRFLVVLWLLLEPTPLVTRMALWLPPQAPLSVPVDAPLNSLEVRGIARQTGAAPVARGPFAGAAQQVLYTTSGGKTARAVLSEKVPLFGVESVELDDERWTAVASGDGARSLLHAVPLKVPRLPALNQP